MALKRTCAGGPRLDADLAGGFGARGAVPCADRPAQARPCADEGAQRFCALPPRAGPSSRSASASALSIFQPSAAPSCCFTSARSMQPRCEPRLPGCTIETFGGTMSHAPSGGKTSWVWPAITTSTSARGGDGPCNAFSSPMSGPSPTLARFVSQSSRPEWVRTTTISAPAAFRDCASHAAAATASAEDQVAVQDGPVPSARPAAARCPSPRSGGHAMAPSRSWTSRSSRT